MDGTYPLPVKPFGRGRGSLTRHHDGFWGGRDGHVGVHARSMDVLWLELLCHGTPDGFSEDLHLASEPDDGLRKRTVLRVKGGIGEYRMPDLGCHQTSHCRRRERYACLGRYFVERG
jgi:hypothetical protein